MKDEATGPGFDCDYPLLAALRRDRPREIGDFERAIEMSRRFRHAVVEPNALAVDRRVLQDPRWVAEDVLREAARHGFFSMMVPRTFGGAGFAFGAMIVGMEELAAGCLGIANLVAVHGLAFAMVAATGDLPAVERVSRLLVEGEREGTPRLLSTGITEPSAGTDVEDVDLLRSAHLDCEAQPVRGGYRLRGRKVFISNGSIAHTHVVLMPTHRGDPVNTTFAFLVERGTAGFSVGRVERKMGQKACPAAELVFDDCFVPETARIGHRPIPGRQLELVLGATRGGVAAWGAGVARGAYERALAFARSNRVGGRWLIDEQWVQLRLADMLGHVMTARSAYVEALLSNELFGLSSLVAGSRVQELLMRHLPQPVLDSRATQRLIGSQRSRQRMRRAVDELADWKVDASSATGAAAKVSATELGMENCHLALDIMGAAGLRHDLGMEKLYRDAKLLTIYEGTNQLNRIELYKKGIARDGRHPGARFGSAPS